MYVLQHACLHTHTLLTHCSTLLKSPSYVLGVVVFAMLSPYAIAYCVHQG